MLRALPRTSLPSLPVRALSTTSSKCQPIEPSSFDSPFRGMGNSPTTKIPDFSKYRSSKNPNSNLVFQYFMVGTMGALTAAGAKATVQGTCRGELGALCGGVEIHKWHRLQVEVLFGMHC
jgi:ubiquinol-cytochrome c reductase iron-sulfur subunit